jgi:bifunctional DNA-binding transcriptional regulator/antitoxin component of YhaV-PrlF toxin-antitoxin module
LGTLIVYTKIREGVILIPKELIDRYKIGDSSAIILEQVEEGILIKLVSNDNLEVQQQVGQKKPMEKEVDAIVDVLSYYTTNGTPLPPRNGPKELKKF